MMSEAVSLDYAINDALRKASIVLAIVAFPALLIASYRNLYLDFLPVHQSAITLIWLGFVLLSLKRLTSTNFRFYALVLLFLSLFFLTGFRNQSFILTDLWLFIVGGLLALKHSLWIVLLITSASGVSLYLIIDEIALFPGLNFAEHVSLHSSALLLSFVLYSAIRNVVLNYQQLYEAQLETNASLIKKNKTSYLLVEEAEENKEDQRRRLRASVYSLYSQLSILQEFIILAKNNNDNNMLHDGISRIEFIKADLFAFTENGRFISPETSKLTISECSKLLEGFITPYSVIQFDDLTISTTSRDAESTKFEFPMHYLTVMVHHLIEHCRQEYEASEIKFEFRKGQKARSMQQIQVSLTIRAKDNLPANYFLSLNKLMDSKRNEDAEDNHTTLIKVILRRLSGTFKASLNGDILQYDLDFWVDR